MSDIEDKKSQQIIELDFDFNEAQVVSDAFFKESAELLVNLDEDILRLESFPHDEILLQGLFRKVHTLKGSVGAVPGGQLLGSLAHEFETLLDRLRKQKVLPTRECIEIFLHSSRMLKILAENLRTHREIYPEELSEVIELITRYGSFQLTASENNAGAEKVFGERESFDRGAVPKDGLWLSKEQMSDLMQVSSDFILLKNSMQQLSGMVDILNPQKLQEKQVTITHAFSRLSDQLQNLLDKAQKTPLKEALSSLVPLIRQTTYELKKEVHFLDHGFELEVDKGLAQDLSQALMHMVRNSLDHGIENLEQRLAAGKNPQGQLSIRFEEKAAVIHCRIQDDGQGMNRERILQRALEKGLTNALEASQMSEEKIFTFIFHPGFSTSEKVTTISGRGVGMDVVQNIVTKYGGQIELKSVAGEGTVIHLQIPVPRKLMVERCLLASWQDHVLAFPLSEVLHIGTCDGQQLTEVDHLRFCQFAGQTIPLLSMEELYGLELLIPREQVQTMTAVLVKAQEFQMALLVDRIQYQVDLVIKPFGRLVGGMPGFKGNSILTDDVIAYVVDASSLQDLFKREAA